MFAPFIYLFILVIINTSQYVLSEEACQSGLREDNTNYIYCARQNLTKIPNFYSNNNNGIVSNLIYDELVLSDNFIQKIDPLSLIKAKKIYLDLNPIQEIYPRSFEHVKNYLEEIYFDKKAIATGTQDVVNIQSLSYDYDQLDSHASNNDESRIFESALFQKCSNLRLLSIKNYNFFTLKKLLFSKLSRLEILIMNNNRLRTIDAHTFLGGVDSSLIELNLASNMLEQVPSDAIAVFRKLKRLNLAQNRIKLLHPNSFFNLKSPLLSLDLSYNFIRDIDLSAFNGQIQNNLKSLSIQNNELNWPNFIYLLFNLYQLNELNVDFNKLSSAYSSNGKNEGSKSILNSGQFINLKLTHLSMQGNGLSEENLKLFTYSYSYNPLMSSLNSNFKLKKFKYPSLLKLNLARNKLKQIPEEFFTLLNMTQLKDLILDRNPLSFSGLKQQFNGLENCLSNLQMNNLNPAGFINKHNMFTAINKLLKLEKLAINNINNYEDILAGEINEPELRLPYLKSLEMSNNNLESVPNFLCQINQLSNLDLSSNFIQSVDKLRCLFKPNSNLKQLNLNNNPLNCDCRMRDLKQWLLKNNDLYDLLEFIKWKCVEPAELADQLLTNVDINDLKCQQDVPLIVEYSTSDVFLFKILDTKTIKTTTIVKTSSSSSPNSTTTTTTTTRKIPPTFIKTFSTPTLNRTKLHARFYTNNQKVVDLNYYSLIIGISLGISTICLVILIFFYITCLRQHQQHNQTSAYQESSKVSLGLGSSLSSSYSSDYLNPISRLAGGVGTINNTGLMFSSPFCTDTNVTTASNSISSYNDLLLKISNSSSSSFHQLKSNNQHNRIIEEKDVRQEEENSFYNNLNYEDLNPAQQQSLMVYSMNSATAATNNPYNHIYHEINQYNNLTILPFGAQSQFKYQEKYTSDHFKKASLNHNGYFYSDYNQNQNDFSHSLIV
jgi:Leucine-rich repeat (LRR) protein